MSERTLAAGILASLLVLSAAAGMPKVACDEPVKDFGIVDNNTQSVVHAFILHNRGDAPLAILGVNSSCGCTTATPTDTTVAPGSSTVIRTALSLQGRKGPQRKPVHIVTNDPMTPQIDLTIACDIRLPIDANPSGFFFTPTFPAGSELKRTVHLTAASNVTFGILSIDTSAVSKADFQLSEVLTGRVFTLTARLRAGAESGYGREAVVVNTDNRSLPRIVLPVVVFISDEVSIVPAEIVLTQSSLSQTPLRRQLFLRVSGTNAWSIAEVVAEGGAALRETTRSPRTVVFDLTNLGAAPDLASKRIRLTVRCDNDGRQRDLVVPFRLWTPSPSRLGHTP